jgi:alpha-glucosidase (family GH31 glycosyl hydrolase)
MTPLPLAYPQDTTTYYRANQTVRGYQWMIGDALLASPLYGNDYATATSRDVYLPEGKWIDYDDGKVYQGPAMLKDFSLPVDKTPLFVGGTGLVVEKVEGKLYGRVYPVGYQGQTVFYASDGKTKSTFTIRGEEAARCTVRDLTAKKAVKTALVRHAWQFELTPGHDYSIQ